MNGYSVILLFHIAETDKTVYVEHCMQKYIAYVLQGEFPDKNTQEDGYVGVAPVDAFPAQNKFGKIYDLS